MPLEEVLIGVLIARDIASLVGGEPGGRMEIDELEGTETAMELPPEVGGGGGSVVEEELPLAGGGGGVTEKF